MLADALDRALTTDLVVIDGGARNGTRELPRLARWIAVHAFEPASAEFESLRASPHRYKRMTYHPEALVQRTGDVILYVSRRPGATSTLRPNAELLAHFGADNWSEMAQIVAEERVPGISLRDLLQRERLDHVDLLKLDTQGNELDIIRSSGDLLPRISVIKTEVEFLPIYQDQALFGDIATFLADAGFELVDIQWSDDSRRYHFDPHLPPSAYRLVWGDAVFAYRPLDMDGPRKIEQAAVLAELGYVDLALYVLQHAAGAASDVRAELIDLYRQRRPPASRSWWKRAAARYLPERWIEASRVMRRRYSKEVASIASAQDASTSVS